MRLDVLLVQKKLANSRTQAQDLIKSGHVFILQNAQKKTLLKPNHEISEDQFDLVSVDDNVLQKFVSRGGLKLESALKHLSLDIHNLVALDVGQSTGGFTDCLLQQGAKLVVGIDVGRDQLHSSLKNHPHVQFFESLHVNELSKRPEFLSSIPKGGFDLIVADVSFISLAKVMIFLKPYLKSQGFYLLLVKPQFEAGPNALDKNGIVKDEKVYGIVQNNVTSEAKKVFGNVLDYFQSGLAGKDGNQEFFIYGKNEL
jgi:23S rRNA (cytidine1920-2'-O)/16S rRNA (cytidine1409-2'-O)-methyltransferase